MNEAANPVPVDEQINALTPRLQRGDGRAYEDLCATSRAPLERMLRSRFGANITSDDIDDAIQDALVGLHAHLASSDAPIRNLFGLLTTIAFNLAATRNRRDKRAILIDDLLLQTESSSEGADVNADEIFMGSTSDMRPAETTVFRGIEMTRIKTAVAQLPLRQQNVVVDHLTDVPPESTCETFGLSPINQRVILHRGKAILRDALSDSAFGDMPKDVAVSA